MAIDNGESAAAGPKTAVDRKWPPWMKPLLEERFFVQCPLHVDSHRRECNMYCLDCADGAFCSLCLADHKDHHWIQIRRSSYHDVIRVNEIQKVVDISGIQTYIINSARVVFLNERPQLRPGKGVTYTCEVCDRGLVDSCRFCSLGCKVSGISKGFIKHQQRKPKRKLHSASAGAEDSYSSSSSSQGKHQLKKQKALPSFSPMTPPTAVTLKAPNRRKGIPHRAPLSASALEY